MISENFVYHGFSHIGRQQQTRATIADSSDLFKSALLRIMELSDNEVPNLRGSHYGRTPCTQCSVVRLTVSLRITDITDLEIAIAKIRTIKGEAIGDDIGGDNTDGNRLHNR